MGQTERKKKERVSCDKESEDVETPVIKLIFINSIKLIVSYSDEHTIREL